MTSDVLDAAHNTLGNDGLDLLFREARTHYSWTDEGVPVDLLKKAYDLAKMGPTSANMSPARFVFLTTPEAKERLLPLLSPTNVEKSRTAPVVALIAYDTEFYEKFSRLFPHFDMKPIFAGDPELAKEAGFRNGTLQAAYFILAARSLGLDCGPMSGFDAEKVNGEFFPDGKWKINFIVNIGHGDGAKIQPRLPRLEFDEVAQVL